MKEYFLGIDGGGTKTAFCLTDMSGNKILQWETDSCYVSIVGEQAVHHIFQQFEKKIQEISLSYDDIVYTCVGMPGYTESPIWDKKSDEILDHIFKDRYVCVNDSVVGWAGSLACRSGINLIAGTGAIAFGRNERGQTAICSGWGHILGDEGSAYWVGSKLLELFTKQSDFRIEKTPLYEIIKSHLNLKTDKELITIVYDQWQSERAKIADLSRLVPIALDQKDPLVMELLDHIAYEISLMVKGVMRQIDFEQLMISYSGGVFRLGEILLRLLQKHLEGNSYQLVSPILIPVYGAVLYAIMDCRDIDRDKFIQTINS
ncbi:MAG: N-acetylglucosamine kinase [Brevinema sp.]